MDQTLLWLMAELAASQTRVEAMKAELAASQTRVEAMKAENQHHLSVFGPNGGVKYGEEAFNHEADHQQTIANSIKAH